MEDIHHQNERMNKERRGRVKNIERTNNTGERTREALELQL